MSIDNQEVLNIAHLARLAVEEADLETYARQLSGILEFVEQINQTDASNVEPMAHPIDATQRLREDEVVEPDQRDYFQTIAPEVEAGFYLVPKVIE